MLVCTFGPAVAFHYSTSPQVSQGASLQLGTMDAAKSPFHQWALPRVATALEERNNIANAYQLEDATAHDTYQQQVTKMMGRRCKFTRILYQLDYVSRRSFETP